MLVKVEKINGVNVVSSRVVAEQLGKEHHDIIKKIKEVLTVGEFSEREFKTERGNIYKEYLLSKDSFILLVMNYQGYNNFKRAYINKFNEMEKMVSEIKVPQTYKEALIELVNAIELKEQAENQVKMLTHQNKLYTSSEIAKELNLKSANELNKILEENKVQYKVNGTWVLTSKYSDKGYTSIKQSVLDSGKIVFDRKWTGTGREFILKMIGGK